MDFPEVRLPQRDGEGAVLLKDWRVSVWLGDTGIGLTVPAGTETDGASIPRFLWRVCGHPLEYPRVYAALVHDWLYGGGDPDVSRKSADGIYRELLIRFGWGKARAGIEYYALRLFGGSHWHE